MLLLLVLDDDGGGGGGVDFLRCVSDVSLAVLDLDTYTRLISGSQTTPDPPPEYFD